MEVVSLKKYKLLKELEEILEETTLTSSDTLSLLDSLLEGKSLAAALRLVGITSAYQIPERVWVQLHPWRNKACPFVGQPTVSTSH